MPEDTPLGRRVATFMIRFRFAGGTEMPYRAHVYHLDSGAYRAHALAAGRQVIHGDDCESPQLAVDSLAETVLASVQVSSEDMTAPAVPR